MLQSVPFAAPKTYLGIYNFKQTQTEVEFLCRFYSNKRTNGRKTSGGGRYCYYILSVVILVKVLF